MRRSPGSAGGTLWERFAQKLNVLTPEQLDFWNENGYLRLENVYTPEEARWQSEELERIMQEWGQMGQGWRGPWRKKMMDLDEADRAQAMFVVLLQNYSQAFTDAVTNPKLTGAVSDMLGGTAVELHGSILHAKAPRLGTPFPLHQDWPFYPHRGPGVLDANLHIDTATEENGCLKFIPGSHKLGPLQHILHTAEEHGDYEQAHLPVEDYPLEDAVSCPANAGDVVFFSYLTIHGSAPNRTDGWRRLIRVSYRDPENEPLTSEDTDWDGPTHQRSKGGPTDNPRGMIVWGEYRNPESNGA